jgi:DNA-directed RNA polymerase subunit alpha
MTMDAIDLALFFNEPELTVELYERYADAAHASASARERFETLAGEYRASVGRGSGDPLKLALSLLALGRFGEALEFFDRAPASKLRHYYAGQAAVGLAQFDRAVQEYQQAAKHGWDGFECDMRVAAVRVRAGDLAGAEKLLHKHEAAGQDRADWYCGRGLVADYRNERVAALEALERALTLDPHHTEALFRSARLYDLSGDDAGALRLYRRLAAQPRAYVNALLNTAVIYEDAGRFDEAMACVVRVLRAFPHHQRARLFFKDVESCQHMVIVEGNEPRVDARSRLLDTPLSEFEFTVRARNCLKKMNVRTLGELIKLTEPELLAYKNFGEQTLGEIKALLAKKGLRLGLPDEEVELTSDLGELTARKAPAVPAGQAAILAKSVAEIELSVRARRCLQRLNVQTLGDLVQYSEADLLATRNFGVTSLNEIRLRLTDSGLSLAPRKPG